MDDAEHEKQISDANRAFEERAKELHQKDGWDHDELVEFAMSSPLLVGDPYNPQSVAARDRIKHKRLAEDTLLDWTKYKDGLTPLPLKDDEVRRLIELSASDYDAFQTLKMLCARWLERREVSSFEEFSKSTEDRFWITFYPLDVGCEVRKWLSDFLLGRVVEPPKPKTVHTYTGRNQRVWHTVATITYCGPTPTREPHNDPVTACAIVAKALNELGISHHNKKTEEWTYRRVAKIWANRAKSHPFCQIPPFPK